jgi:hypothetical protein
MSCDIGEDGVNIRGLTLRRPGMATSKQFENSKFVFAGIGLTMSSCIALDGVNDRRYARSLASLAAISVRFARLRGSDR